MNELKARGVEDVLIVVCDGLTGLPAAVTACWPAGDRADLHRAPGPGVAALGELQGPQARHRRAPADLRRADRAGRPGGAGRLDRQRRRQDYPAIKRQWETAWEQVIPFFAFAPEARKVIYTTNMIESINYQLRKISKTRGHFPNDDALVKLLYLGCRELGRTDIRGREGRGGRRTTTGRWP